MRPFTSTITLDEARRRLDAAMRPIARTEHIRISDEPSQNEENRSKVAAIIENLLQREANLPLSRDVMPVPPVVMIA